LALEEEEEEEQEEQEEQQEEKEEERAGKASMAKLVCRAVESVRVRRLTSSHSAADGRKRKQYSDV
jgi:hypothetical protein